METNILKPMRNIIQKSSSSVLPGTLHHHRRRWLSSSIAASPKPETSAGMEIIKCQQHNIVYVLSRGQLININNVFAVTIGDCCVDFHIPVSPFKPLSFSYPTNEEATKDFNRLASHVRHMY